MWQQHVGARSFHEPRWGLDKLQRDTGRGALSGWWEWAGEEEEQKGGDHRGQNDAKAKSTWTRECLSGANRQSLQGRGSTMKTPKCFLEVPQTCPNSCWLWGLAPLISQCRRDASALGWEAEATGMQFEPGRL